ncbi:DUF3038 domain-containing protein [Baaleninema sp.]|uniref:DUF3038 domain-containing protein n=1 Tax=Baaleninema sp. TaxID=3101197 RepID=UPI003D0400DF
MLSNPPQTQTANPQTSKLTLDRLPDMPVTHHGCSRRTRVQLDLALLAIEALNLHGSQDILALAKQLELDGILPNRVTLWRVRNTNPLRRAHRRRPMSLAEAKALTLIVCYMARRMTLALRQLLKEYQQLVQQQLPLEKSPPLAFYLERFRAHFRSRMNPRRSAILVYSTDEKINELAIALLEQLLFCTGTAGLQRFWVSLFDGEV